MAGADGFQNVAGRVVGTLAALESLRRPGGLGQFFMQANQMRADPEQRAALTDSPFTSGFLGLGGHAVPVGAVSEGAQGPMPPPGSPTVWQPTLPPLPPERFLQQRVAEASMAGIDSPDPFVRAQAKGGLGITMSPEEDLALQRAAQASAGPGTKVTIQPKGSPIARTYGTSTQGPTEYATRQEAEAAARSFGYRAGPSGRGTWLVKPPPGAAGGGGTIVLPAEFFNFFGTPPRSSSATPPPGTGTPPTTPRGTPTEQPAWPPAVVPPRAAPPPTTATTLPPSPPTTVPDLDTIAPSRPVYPSAGPPPVGADQGFRVAPPTIPLPTTTTTTVPPRAPAAVPNVPPGAPTMLPRTFTLTGKTASGHATQAGEFVYPPGQAEDAKLDYARREAVMKADVQRRLNPPTDGAVNGLATLLTFRSFVNDLQNRFTPDERAHYVGRYGLRFGITNVLQGIRDDPKFADFRSTTSRLQAALFAEGGKALTEMELAVLRAAIPSTDVDSPSAYESSLRTLTDYLDRTIAARTYMASMSAEQLQDPATVQNILGAFLAAPRAGATSPTTTTTTVPTLPSGAVILHRGAP